MFYEDGSLRYKTSPTIIEYQYVLSRNADGTYKITVSGDFGDSMHGTFGDLTFDPVANTLRFDGGGDLGVTSLFGAGIGQTVNLF